MPAPRARRGTRQNHTQDAGSFERNLESPSPCLLVLLDTCCSLLHHHPALAAHLATAPIRTTLVLTKVNIAARARADAWVRSLRARFHGVRVAQADAYAHGGLESAEVVKRKHTSQTYELPLHVHNPSRSAALAARQPCI
ncbi:hypothetical protein POSPLADRAFT_1051436 [Postia placenta MAD-698-R-SB12]|uniref:Uncharacterized protein n=1 Tax=Postia placenta MAD-698-R-SB12 TaxID=670580 RepID=A0A1X6NFU4_9APHY|nr:hypothetical protein POSPLADRAFT_1051436 [Postia placenta MAD-698-R-SB12]OSX67286.1 hypothetical protein POSPLADRAFT_1051436 [Postia placenta MAD-698-R-SB12]